MRMTPEDQAPILTVDDLHLLLDADFEAGTLTWKPRSREFFKSDRSYKIFHVRFCGKEALNAKHPDGYKNGGILGKAYLTHRVLLAMKLGYWPEYVDHINGNRADNRIVNLRPATRVQNARNQARPFHNTSGCIGVSWNNRDQRWTAYITLNRKRKALGNFKTFEEAVECRKSNEAIYDFHPNHGRAACLAVA
jgi:hypothetical protein